MVKDYLSFIVINGLVDLFSTLMNRPAPLRSYIEEEKEPVLEAVCCEISVVQQGPPGKDNYVNQHVPSRTTVASINVRTIRPEFIKRQRGANLIRERRPQRVCIQIQDTQSGDGGQLRGNATCQLIHI